MKLRKTFCGSISKNCSKAHNGKKSRTKKLKHFRKLCNNFPVFPRFTLLCRHLKYITSLDTYTYKWSLFNPIPTGPFRGSSVPGGGWFGPPLYNFSISYASALKIVTGMHQRLVNTLVQKKIWWHQHFFYDVIFPQGPKFFLKTFFFFFFFTITYKLKFIIKNHLKKNYFLKFKKNIYSLTKSGCQGNTAAYFPKKFFP